jgi:hypothetical protein
VSSYVVTVDMPNLPKGEEVTITGLGAFVNGEATVVDEETENAFRVANQTSTSTHDEDGFQTLEWALGPSLLEANLPKGVTVEEVADGSAFNTLSTPQTTGPAPDATPAGEQTDEIDGGSL